MTSAWIKTARKLIVLNLIFEILLLGCGRTSTGGLETSRNKILYTPDDFDLGGAGPGTSTRTDHKGGKSELGDYLPGIRNEGKGPWTDLTHFDGIPNPFLNMKWKSGESLADFILRVVGATPPIASLFRAQVCAVVQENAQSDKAAAFIVGVALNVLGYFPSVDQLRQWRNQLGDVEVDANRERFALSLLMSPEGLAYFVNSTYFALLHRGPDPGGRDYWVSRMQQSGKPWETLLMGVGGSPENFNTHGGNLSGWVRGLYIDLLSREPEPEGQAYWEQYATENGREAAVGHYLTAPEYLNRLIGGWYVAFLGRGAEQGGLEYWRNTITYGQRHLMSVEAGILGSREYFNKAVQRQKETIDKICSQS